MEKSDYALRTLDDILSKLSKAIIVSMGYTVSRYCCVPLDLQSSLLITFNTPWGKFSWIKEDIFQEKLDRVLELIPFAIGIADDIIYGEGEIEHDVNFITLCETARANGLKLNAKKLQFKSKDCKFFRYNLRADEDKIEAIVKMEPLKNETEL